MGEVVVVIAECDGWLKLHIAITQQSHSNHIAIT